jgi:hypothetical protein
MYRTADLGSELARLDHEPAGCAVYFFGAVSGCMGLSILAPLVIIVARIRDMPVECCVLFGVGLLFLLPGIMVCWNSWSRARTRVSYVFHELALVRSTRLGSLVVRWTDIARITRIHLPSSTDTFILLTRAGEKIEMSSAYLRGVTDRTSELLAELTDLAIETIPGALREDD